MEEINNIVRLENLGTVNKNVVKIGNLCLWFSYKTIVAFRGKTGFYCRVNDWSTTTGKLLNEIEPDKEKRINGALFEEKLKECLIAHGLINVKEEILNVMN